MPYKVALLIRKVDTFIDSGKFIPADEITIDTITDTTATNHFYMFLAWFNPASLVASNLHFQGNCSKVQFAISSSYPAGGAVNFDAQDTEDVPNAELFKSNHEYTDEEYKSFVIDHARVIGVEELIEVSVVGSGESRTLDGSVTVGENTFAGSSFKVPASMQPTNNKLKIAFIPLTKISNVVSSFLYAWTIKPQLTQTDSASIVSEM